jgi:UDP-N-acetylmuramoyl-L-alanyl-D-glutamate--2,6-diaminopimelate ligase
VNLRRLVELVRRKGTDVEVAGEPGLLELEVSAITNRPGEAGPHVVLVVDSTTRKGEVREALRRGAAALVTERAWAAPVPVLRVPHAREALRQLLAAFYTEPSHELVLWGVTGAGQTTVAFLLHRCLVEQGLLPGLWADVTGAAPLPRSGFPAGRLVFLRHLAEAGGQAAVLSLCPHEVADGGLTGPELTGLLALDGLPPGFDRPPGSALVVVPDGHRPAVLPERLFTFGPAPRADLRALPAPPARSGPPPESAASRWTTLWGQALEFQTGPRLVSASGDPGPGRFRVTLALPGPAYRRAAAAAATAALLLGIPPERVSTALSAFPGVWRRLQLVYQGSFTVVDDVAQTPREVAATLAALDEAAGRARRDGAGPLFRGVITVCAVAGGQGPSANAALGRALARLLARRGATRLIATESLHDVPPDFAATVAERQAFVGACRSAGGSLEYYPLLDDALQAALSAARDRDLILLLGGANLNLAQIRFQDLLATRPYLAREEPYDGWGTEPLFHPLGLAALTRKENLPGSRSSPRTPPV